MLSLFFCHVLVEFETEKNSPEAERWTDVRCILSSLLQRRGWRGTGIVVWNQVFTTKVNCDSIIPKARFKI